MTDDKLLAGKTAVVTGAGRGIGHAIALAFARAGADLAICSRTSEEIDETRSAAEDTGVRCFAGAVDLADPDATERFCRDALAEFGTIDVLVNNAGAYLDRGKVGESDPEKWWRTIEVNVRGPYLVTRYLLEGLADGAKIINITSGKGFRAGENSSSYHVSKAGLNMLTEALANELWPRHIDVNLLIPGPVATSGFSRETPGERSSPEEILERFSEELPPGLPSWERLKHPDEVADLALKMATQPLRGPTGQIFSLARRPL